MHQNSLPRKLTDIRLCHLKPWRRVRKISDGGGLYVLVAPTDGRYWRYNYRFEGKQKTIALGVYPDVSLHKARARHEARPSKCSADRLCDPPIAKRTRALYHRLRLE
jgi:hypothetical protein